MSQNIELNKRTEKEENQKKNLTVFGQETEFDGESLAVCSCSFYERENLL